MSWTHEYTLQNSSLFLQFSAPSTDSWGTASLKNVAHFPWVSKQQDWWKYRFLLYLLQNCNSEYPTNYRSINWYILAYLFLFKKITQIVKNKRFLITVGLYIARKCHLLWSLSQRDCHPSMLHALYNSPSCWSSEGTDAHKTGFKTY